MMMVNIVSNLNTPRGNTRAMKITEREKVRMLHGHNFHHSSTPFQGYWPSDI